MKRRLVVFMAIAFFVEIVGVAAQEPAFGFKRWQLGTTQEDAAATLPRACIKTGEDPRVSKCFVTAYTQRETIAETPVKYFNIDFFDGKIGDVTVYFNSSARLLVFQALTEKYGNSSARTETLTNRAGAEFENVINTWDRAGERMILKKYAGDVETGSLQIHTRIYNDYAIEQFKNRGKKAAKDL